MFEQVTLNYTPDSLAPHIGELTVNTHYGKHHATYTKTFNEAVATAGLEGKSCEEILSNLNSVSDDALRTKLRNNGGGYYNHNLYFMNLSSNPGKPSDKLLSQINKDFSSLDELIKRLTDLALSQFGSGWAWLCCDKEGNLSVSKTPNQDNPYSLNTGLKPLIALDVWEHAYYLDYKNLRGEYIKNFFELLDWASVSKLYEDYIG
jgi:Fe-Mn family superoxide dismutase